MSSTWVDNQPPPTFDRWTQGSEEGGEPRTLQHVSQEVPPVLRRLFETIKRLSQFTDLFVWFVLEQFWLKHVDVLLQCGLGEGHLDIPVFEFMGRVLVENDQHNTEGFTHHDTGKSLLVVHSVFLGESHCNKTGLELDNSSGLVPFVIKDHFPLSIFFPFGTLDLSTNSQVFALMWPSNSTFAAALYALHHGEIFASRRLEGGGIPTGLR